MVFGLGDVLKAVEISRTQVDREHALGDVIVVRTRENPYSPVFPDPFPQRDELVRYI